MKIEAFMNWVQRWEFLITLLLGVFLGLGLTASMKIIPENFKIHAIGLFMAILFLVAFVLLVADIGYKYREIQTSKSFFSPFTLQKWEHTVTISNKDGSAKIQATRVITAQEGVDIPFINLNFWSESEGEDIKHTCTKVNGNEKTISTDNITRETKTGDGYTHKSLNIKVPVLNKVSPSVEIVCDLDYPPGAFKKAFDGKEDTFSARISHSTRLLKLNLELGKDLPEGKYMFDQPSFEVHDFFGNNVGRVEEMIRKEKAYPEYNSRKISWDIINPKVGLVYTLNFKIFTLKTTSFQKRLSNNYPTTNN